jgi:CO dehydrogenase/acetyl-CoA synthase gamma subunit (corrinoid Fe-S protein)
MTNSTEEENEMGCINYTLLYKKYKYIDVMIYKSPDTWKILPTIILDNISRASRKIYKPSIGLQWLKMNFVIYFN